MLDELWLALALMLVIEGVFPFLSPQGLRESLLRMIQMNDRTLRLAGLGSMIVGVVLLYLLK